MLIFAKNESHKRIEVFTSLILVFNFYKKQRRLLRKQIMKDLMLIFINTKLIGPQITLSSGTSVKNVLYVSFPES